MEIDELEMPSHEQLSQALAAAGLSTSASETHGLICGVLCAAVDAAGESNWIPVLLKDRDESRQDEAKHLSLMLMALHRHTMNLLQDTSFTFRLLLPPDDREISERLEGLAEWCSGYLTGLVAGGVSDISKLPGDAAEIARDLLQISEVIPSAGAGKDKEADFMEVEEYVRLGVCTIYEELHRVATP